MRAVDGRGGGAGGHVNAASPGVLAGPLPVTGSLNLSSPPRVLSGARDSCHTALGEECGTDDDDDDEWRPVGPPHIIFSDAVVKYVMFM